jgi:hypothetical protein
MSLDWASPHGHRLVSNRDAVLLWLLLKVLIGRSRYSELCPAPQATTGPPIQAICSARSVAFNLIFSCGAVTAQASGVVVGSVLDCFGPRKTIVLGHTLVIFGSLLFAETSGRDVAIWTLPLAYALFGFGGNMIHLSGFSLANLFPPSRRPTLVATFVMTFTLSGFTFQLMLLSNIHGGLSLQLLFRLLGLLQGVHLVISATQWPSSPLQSGDKLVVRGWRLAVSPADLAPVTLFIAASQRGTTTQTKLDGCDVLQRADPEPGTIAASMAPEPAQMASTDGESRFPSHWGNPPMIQTRDLRELPGDYGMGSGTLKQWIEEKMAIDAVSSAHASTGLDATPYGGLRVRAQLLHPEFVLLTVFFTVLSFTLRFYMGAVREQLMQGVAVHTDNGGSVSSHDEAGLRGVAEPDSTGQTEEDEIDLLVEVFNVIIALGFACVPLYGCVVNK